MIIEYRLDIEDLLALVRYQVRDRPVYRRSRRNQRFMALVGGGLSTVAALVLGSTFLLIVGLAWFAFGVFIGPIHRMLVGRTVRRQERDGDFRSRLGRVRLSVDEEGLVAEIESTTSKLSWSGVERIVETADHVFVHTDPSEAWIVPKRALEPEPGVERFLEMLELGGTEPVEMRAR